MQITIDVTPEMVAAVKKRKELLDAAGDESIFSADWLAEFDKCDKLLIVDLGYQINRMLEMQS